MAQMIRDVLSSMGLKAGGDKRILMLGLDASGRTTTLYMLKLGEIVTTIPTIGFNVETIEFKHPKLGHTAITAWDVGGCDKIRPLWRHYFAATQGLIWFVDSNDRDRISEACDELHRAANESELDGVPILVLANKQDLPNSMSVEEVQRRMKMGLFKDREWNCMPAVATTGDGLYEAIFWLSTAMDTWLRSPEYLNKKARPEPEQEEPILEQWLKLEDGPDDVFLKGVEDYTLDSWDHRTHLRLAWLNLKRHGRREGMRRIFASIKSFIENSPRTKRGSGRGTTFHATLTYTWAHLVDFAIASTKNPTETFKGFLIMNPQLSNGGLPLHYFTKKLLFDSAESRAEVVLPDKRPLPSIITNINHLEIKARNDPSKVLGPPKKTLDPLTDVQFLASVRDRTAQGWGHEAMLRVVWACLRLHGVRQGPDYASHVLRSFQGDGFHYTITRYWCQVLRKLMVHDWQPAVVRLDAAAVARDAAWKVRAAEQQVASQAALQDSQWATDLLKTLTEGQPVVTVGQPVGTAGAAERPVRAATAAELQVEQATGAGAAQVAADEAGALPSAVEVAGTSGGEMHAAAAAAAALQPAVAQPEVVLQPAESSSPADDAAQPAYAAAGLGSSSMGSHTQPADEQPAGPSASIPAKPSLPCPPALPFTTLPTLARAPSIQASVPASSPAGRQQSQEADWVMLDTQGSGGTGTAQLPGAATTVASSGGSSGTGTAQLSGAATTVASSGGSSGTGTAQLSGAATTVASSGGSSGTGTAQLSGAATTVASSGGSSGTGTAQLSGAATTVASSGGSSGTGTAQLPGAVTTVASSGGSSGTGTAQLPGAATTAASSGGSSGTGTAQLPGAVTTVASSGGSSGTGTAQLPGAATTAASSGGTGSESIASSVLDEVARMRVVDSVASMAGMRPGDHDADGGKAAAKQPQVSVTQVDGHTTTAMPAGVKAAALHPGGLFLLESCDPDASAQIPTFHTLLAGQGYASETARKLVLDQHMYLIHYSKKLIYSDEAARTLVVPDKQQLPSLA